MAFKLAYKLGYNPPFQFIGEQEEGFYEGGIDYEALANKLAKASRFPFDYKNFANSPIIFTSNPLNEGEEYTVENNTHLVVTETLEGDLLNVGNVSDAGKEISRKLNISGKLNKKTALVAVRKGKVTFSFRFKLNEYTKYVKKIKYEYLNETAIELTTFSYNDYSALSKHINTSDNPSVKALIIEKFNQAFSKVDKDVSSLKWLYENAPQFVLTQRGDDKLIADFKKLVTYDKDSWFKDASSAILNLLLGFKDISKAYTYFNDNPQETIKTYSILDSASQNQFCLVLDLLSKLFTSNPKRRRSAKFIISKDYTLNSNIFLSDNQEEILLEQSKVTKETKERTSFDEFGVPFQSVNTTTTKTPVSQQTQFHPLDLVTLVNSAGEEEIVTALHVKGLSDQAEWAQVVSNTILVVSIIVIIASAGTLAAGATGVVAAIAVTEIVVASLDILQEVLKSADQEKLGDADKWFVKNWDAISGTHGVISLGGLIRKGVLKNGPKLLASISAVNVTENVLKIRKAVNAAILSIRIELYFASRLGLTYCKILPFPDVVNFIGSKFANKMAKFGVNVTEPVDGSTDIKGLIYNGEKIAEGTKSDFKEILKDIFPYSDESKVLAKLDELTEIARIGRTGTGGSLKYLEIISKNSNKMVSQERNMSCAAACIRQFVKDSNIILAEKEVRILAKTTDTYGTLIENIGPTLEKILDKSIKFGHAYNSNLTNREMLEILTKNNPWIAVIKPVGGIEHTIIIDKVIGNSVYIRDPWPINGIGKSKKGVEAIVEIDVLVNAWERGGQYFARITN